MIKGIDANSEINKNISFSILLCNQGSMYNNAFLSLVNNTGSLKWNEKIHVSGSQTHRILFKCINLNCFFQAKAFLRTSAMNPTSVITLEDITTIFYKMDDFYQIHHEFVTEMNKKVQNWSDDQEIADDVKKLVRIQERCALSKFRVMLARV